MNGFTKYETSVRDNIAGMIRSGECNRAREVSRKFTSHKSRGAKRRMLLKSTVKFWISLMNGDDCKSWEFYKSNESA